MPSIASVTFGVLAAVSPTAAAVMHQSDSSLTSLAPAHHGLSTVSTIASAHSAIWRPSRFRTSTRPTSSPTIIETRTMDTPMQVNSNASINSPPAVQRPRNYKRDDDPEAGDATLFEDPIKEDVSSILYWTKIQAHNKIDTELETQEATDFPDFYNPDIADGRTLVNSCRNPFFREAHKRDVCSEWINVCVDDDYNIKIGYQCNGFTEGYHDKLGKFVNKRCPDPAFREKHKFQNWCQGWEMLEHLKSCRDKAFFDKDPVGCTRAMAREADIKHNSLDLDWINPTCDWDVYSKMQETGSMMCDPWHREQERIMCRKPGKGYDDGDDCKFTCLTDQKCPRQVEFEPRIKELCIAQSYFDSDGHWGIWKELLCHGKPEDPPVCKMRHPAELPMVEFQMMKEQHGW